MRTINLCDYTLRQYNESKSRTLLFREKVALAENLDSFGIDGIELAAVSSPKEDIVVDRTIASVVKNASLKIPVGFRLEDVETAWECVKDAVSPVLEISVPVSTVQMEYMYHVKDAKMTEKLLALLEKAKSLCSNVEFVAQDATRADPVFLKAICEKLSTAGVTAITLCDDAGDDLPEEFASLVRDICGVVSVPVSVRVSDKLGLAVGNMLASLEAGASGVSTCIEGDQVLTLGSVSDFLEAKGEKVGVCAGIKSNIIHSGINSILKKFSQNDYMSSSDQNSGKQGIFLDSGSSMAQVSEAIASLGYDITNEDLGKVYDALLAICRKKNSIGGKELEALIASTAMQVPSTFHLVSYNTVGSNLTNSMSHVVLRKDGEELSGVATGDGPIDSSFEALEQCVGHHYELDEFQIQAVTEGREALGSALVRLRNNGKLYSGNGLSADIVGASIRAYLNALNKIVYEER